MSRIEKELFGKIGEHDVLRFNLSNERGNGVSILNYGGIINAWMIGGKNIVTGFNHMEDYRDNPAFFGCLVGRYANRIANGCFTIDGLDYSLACNNAGHHLHGGKEGFNKKIWEASVLDAPQPKLLLRYKSAEGEEGYPGNLELRVQFTYTDTDELVIEYEATTDKPTPVNFTSHSYFNLAGDTGQTIHDHVLAINADRYTPVDGSLIPTGELKDVAGGQFDFRSPVLLRERLEATGGYDINFVLNKAGDPMSFAAILQSPGKELVMNVYTTEPGLQLYTGNFLDGQITTSEGKPIIKHSALCLETQHFPDSPNHPGFPSTILRPGETFYSTTVYQIRY